MSTRLDILAAKAEFDDHVGAHKCRAQFATAEPGPRCDKRVALWLAYMDVAGRWGTEDTDAARVAESYAWHTAILDEPANPARYALRAA
jgi:hypothetical protein